MARHERVIVDLGTGDGRAALAASAADPRSLVIGIDANAASMADVSRRAARSRPKGRQGVVVFVVAAAEAPPVELTGLADEVRVLFPWGSLLRGMLGMDEAVAAGTASMIRPGGRLNVLVSITARDGLDGLDRIDDSVLSRVADAHRPFGVELVEARPASAEEVRATRSTWARRLLAGAAERPVWRLEYLRADGRDRDLRYDRSNDAPERRVILARDTMNSNLKRRSGARPIRGDRRASSGR